MRVLIAVLLIVYFVGVGVALGPAFQADWNSVPGSQFAANMAKDMPRALAWPEAAYRRLTAATS
jgi:hypothetical protein